MIRILLPAAFAALAVPAAAQDQPAPADTAAKPVKEKKICRREQVMNSNIPKSTCHTAAEWAQVDRNRMEAAQQTIADGRNGGH